VNGAVAAITAVMVVWRFLVVALLVTHFKGVRDHRLYHDVHDYAPGVGSRVSGRVLLLSSTSSL
jgi:hypothetical protein